MEGIHAGVAFDRWGSRYPQRRCAVRTGRLAEFEAGLMLWPFAQRLVERTAGGISRSLLATACVLLPLIPTTSPHDTLHDVAWITMVLCGSVAWLCQGRAKAWLVAGMAWSVWLSDVTGSGVLGSNAQVVIIAGLAFGVLVIGQPTKAGRFQRVAEILAAVYRRRKGAA